MKRTICSIYRSSRKEGMYLYVDKKEGLARVPEALLTQFGAPQHAMTLLIDEQRKLARADAAKVLEGIETQGFYLQLPPEQENLMPNRPERGTR